MARLVGEGGGTALCPAAEQRRALREGHEDTVAHVARAVHVLRSLSPGACPEELRVDVGAPSARCGRLTLARLARTL